MKILFITPEFPPIVTPQSLRWFYLLSILSEKYHYEIDVVSPRVLKGDAFYQDQFSIDSFLADASIFYTDPGILSKSRATMNKTNQASKAINTNRKNRMIKKVFQKCLSPFLIPDRMIDWVVPGYLMANRLMKNKRYDVIISSGPPFSSHIVGGLIASRTKIPWVADFGDPWSFNSEQHFRRKWRKKIEHRMEQRLFRRMRRVIFTTKRTAERYSSIYPAFKEKFSVIQQGADASKYRRKVETKKNTLVYTGIFYKDIREPFELFAAMNTIDDYQLIIVGNVDTDVLDYVKRNHLEQKIRFMGYVSHEDSITWQLSSEYLVYIDNKNSTQLPGKLFEYLAAKKPILCVVQNNDSLLVELAKEYPQIVICQNNSTEIVNALEKLKTQDCGNNHNVDWSHRAHDLDALLKNLNE
jgi:hypothetical protein